MRTSFITIIGLTLMMFVVPSPASAEPITPQEAHDIAVEAYIYFYPLVSMDVTRRQMTNADSGANPMFGPMNAFLNMRAYPTADMKAVVRPNCDTLCSSAWLDLTREPVIISVPDTNGR